MTEHAVLIAGGGPTGLVLASELANAGVDVAIVERRLTQELAGSRASGFHARTLEELDQRGLADRFVELGTKHHVVPFPGTMLDRSDMPTRFNYTLGIWQNKIELMLTAWVNELGVKFYRGDEVTGFTQDSSGVDVALQDGRTLRARYLVGCDGGRSLVRKQAGIAFPGWEASLSYLIFEADFEDEPPWGIQHTPRGICAIGKIETGRARGVQTEIELKHGDDPTVDELRAALVSTYGADFGVHNVTWLSRFTDAARQAETYRQGRVLLAGDAAHIHSPTGGQGLNIGVQDAMNLGWKLAQVVKRISPDTLLDTYHAERHPVGEAILKHTLAITALRRGDDRTNSLREMLPRVMQMDEPRRWYGAMMAGLDIRYDLGNSHPLIGRRMPDLDISTADGDVRVFSLLHEARPVLLNFGAPGAIIIQSDYVKRIDAHYNGVWTLPVLGDVDPPCAVLIRPDGYVAWAGERGGLTEALASAVGIAA